MVVALSIIILAFAWLLYETRFLTIRLGYSKPTTVKLLNAGKVTVMLALPPASYKPSLFTPCDLDIDTGINVKTTVNVAAKIA